MLRVLKKDSLATHLLTDGALEARFAVQSQALTCRVEKTLLVQSDCSELAFQLQCDAKKGWMRSWPELRRPG